MNPPPNPSDDDCYVCYGFHYLDEQMKMRGLRGNCFGYEQKTGMRAIPKKMPGNPTRSSVVSIISFGQTQYTGRMNKLGITPITRGFQLVQASENSDNMNQNHNQPNVPIQFQNVPPNTPSNSKNNDTAKPVVIRNMIDVYMNFWKLSSDELEEYSRKFYFEKFPNTFKSLVNKTYNAATILADGLPSKMMKNVSVLSDRVYNNSIVLSKRFVLVGKRMTDSAAKKLGWE